MAVRMSTPNKTELPSIPKNTSQRIDLRNARMGKYLVNVSYGPNIFEHAAAGILGAAAGTATLMGVTVFSVITGTEPKARWYIGLPLVAGAVAAGGFEHICNDVARFNAAEREAKRQQGVAAANLEALEELQEGIGSDQCHGQELTSENLRRIGLPQEDADILISQNRAINAAKVQRAQAQGILASYQRNSRRSISIVAEYVEKGLRHSYCQRPGELTQEQRGEVYDATAKLLAAEKTMKPLQKTVCQKLANVISVTEEIKEELDLDVELLGPLPKQ